MKCGKKQAAVAAGLIILWATIMFSFELSQIGKVLGVLTMEPGSESGGIVNQKEKFRKDLQVDDHDALAITVNVSTDSLETALIEEVASAEPAEVEDAFNRNETETEVSEENDNLNDIAVVEEIPEETTAAAPTEPYIEVVNPLNLHVCAECQEFLSTGPIFQGNVDRKLLSFSLGEIVLRSFGNGTFEVANITDITFDLSERVLLMVSTSDGEFLQKTIDNVRGFRDENLGNYTDDILLMIPYVSSESVDDLISAFARQLHDIPVLVKFIPFLGGRMQTRYTEYYKFKKLKEPWTHFIKFFIFDRFVQNWGRVLYLDVGIELYNKLEYMWELYEPGYLLAHNDSYPTDNWKLIDKCSCDFYPDLCFKLVQEVGSTLNVWYFQSTVMLFDTKAVISSTSSRDLFELFSKYNFLSGDQTYLSLYFAVIHPKWKTIPLRTKDGLYWSYDFCLRKRNPQSLVMTKHAYWCES